MKVPAYHGAVAKRQGEGLQHPYSAVQIRPAPLRACNGFDRGMKIIISLER